MKLALLTDAWEPQVNGVVRTLMETRRCLENDGHAVFVLSPSDHPTVPCPTYPEIRLALLPYRRVRTMLDRAVPDAIHIATEGPVGIAGRRYCQSRGLAFTTSYHTRFPEYIRVRAPIPIEWTYAYLRRHHGAARRTLVATKQMREVLEERGFDNVVVWRRGVDAELVKRHARTELAGERPILMYAGRVAVEKNLEAFLALEVPETKYVVGDGPARATLSKEYPNVQFVGYRFEDALAAFVASADVFVFPSLTDTFGLVMLEAIACGTPVAAFPITGPIEVVEDGVTGSLNERLDLAVEQALTMDRQTCRQRALERTWTRASKRFLSYLVDVETGKPVDADLPVVTKKSPARRHERDGRTSRVTFRLGFRMGGR